MSTPSFWNKFVPAEVKESRFGMIPAGNNTVHIIDVRPLMASQTFHLDDQGMITKIEDKKDFDKQFDQEILAIVFQDEEGRVLIDRRSEKGWATADEKDVNGKLKFTAELIQRNGLKSVGARFTDSKGRGVKSTEKTASCADMASRLFNASGATNLEGLKGSELQITVKTRTFDGKDRPEAVGYYPMSWVFKAEAGNPVKLEVVHHTTPAVIVPEPEEELAF